LRHGTRLRATEGCRGKRFPDGEKKHTHPDKCPSRYEFTVGEVQCFCRRKRNAKTQRDQGIGTANGQSTEQGLKKSNIHGISLKNGL
jgi:hypothetical protein